MALLNEKSVSNISQKTFPYSILSRIDSVMALLVQFSQKPIIHHE